MPLSVLICIKVYSFYLLQWNYLYHNCCCSVTKSCLTLCDPMNCSTPGFPVLRYLLEFAQTHVHRVSDAIQPSHPLLSPSPLAFSLSQHQGLFQWVSSSHQVAKELELQVQHQSFQWISFRMDWFDVLYRNYQIPYYHSNSCLLPLPEIIKSWPWSF